MADLPSDDAIRDAAAEVLARQEYARFRLEELDWLLAFERWLQEAAGWLRDLADVSPWLFGLFLAGLVALALLMLFHIAWSLRVALRGGAHREDATPAAPPRRDFVAEARELAAAGDRLGACRALQFACLDLLMRAGTLELARHHGNATLRARLRRSPLAPELCADLIAAIDALERAWFRDRTPGDALYEDWLRIHRGLTGATS